MNLAVARKLVKAVDENRIPESLLKGKDFTSESQVDELVSDFKEVRDFVGAKTEEKPTKTEEKPAEKKQSNVIDKDIEEWAKGPGPRYSI